jgi:hypothetical protein
MQATIKANEKSKKQKLLVTQHKFCSHSFGTKPLISSQLHKGTLSFFCGLTSDILMSGTHRNKIKVKMALLM